MGFPSFAVGADADVEDDGPLQGWLVLAHLTCVPRASSQRLASVPEIQPSGDPEPDLATLWRCQVRDPRFIKAPARVLLYIVTYSYRLLQLGLFAIVLGSYSYAYSTSIRMLPMSRAQNRSAQYDRPSRLTTTYIAAARISSCCHHVRRSLAASGYAALLRCWSRTLRCKY